MTPFDALVLFLVLTLPSVACRMGYRRGVSDEHKRLKDAEAIRLRYCQCGVQKPQN